jgi:uncharacterized repeat protein (TIGR03803 family)
MQRTRLFPILNLTLAVVVSLMAATGARAQQTENVLYNFQGGSDGANPYAGLIQDPKGNFYGTTTGLYGGNSDVGTVFKLDATGKETVLHSFTGTPDGANPYAGLIQDTAGNLYGTTRYGGASNWGTVFKVDSVGNETVLYNFTGGVEGGNPTGRLLMDSGGNLYGTTTGSGTAFFGNVFKLDTTGKESVLYSFTGGTDGNYPQGTLIQDAAGNLYGTTYRGGASGVGTIFKLAVNGQETVLYSFTGLADGGNPQGGLTRDSAGNLYGTSAPVSSGYGTVFKLSPAGTETILHSFVGSDGSYPTRGVLRDTAGNLYGTTSLGGAYGFGTVFELSATGTETVLYSFTGGNDGSVPYSDLIQDVSGNLYGTTTSGGANSAGVVFEITGILPASPWQPLKKPLCSGVQPCFNASTALLLTDGSVMVQEYCSANWWKLSPNPNPKVGSPYINGTWKKLASSVFSVKDAYAPLFYASAVLPDGRVIVEGGELAGKSCASDTQVETSEGAIFDPTMGPNGIGAWTKVAPPTGWTNIGDAQSVILPNGTFMLGNCGYPGSVCSPFYLQQALLGISGTSLSWTITGTGKADQNSEEGWTLLPNGKVLAVDVWKTKTMSSELYDPDKGAWSPVPGDTVEQLVNTDCVAPNGVIGSEIGPAVLRPDGTVFALGGTGHTAIYTTSSNSWSMGLDNLFSDGLGVNDGPAALLPDGNVLVDASPISPCYSAGSRFFEFDGTNLTEVPKPPSAGLDASFQGRMLVLPTGQVLFTDGSSDVEIYTPSGTPNQASRPTIKANSYPPTITLGATGYSISGTQFNGLSQGAMYGDDAQMATNYPLVQITDAKGNVFYARTYGNTSNGQTYMGVTPKQPTSTNFDAPACVGTICPATGVAHLVVVANGIASAPPVSVTIAAQ